MDQVDQMDPDIKHKQDEEVVFIFKLVNCIIDNF